MSERHTSEERVLFLEPREIVVDNFDAPGYILDIGGGGEGIIGLLKGEQVVSIDTRRGELAEAPSGPLKIVMDARELQFLDESFHTATAFFTLMYVKEQEDCERVFQEVYRVLRPGGRFLIWDGVLPTRPDTEKEIVAFHILVKLPDRDVSTGYGARWPAEEKNLAYYAQLAESQGFEVATKEERERVFFLELHKR